MATAVKRQQTRRRIAAINFLSSISLDGNRETKFGLVFFNVSQLKPLQIDNDVEEQESDSNEINYLDNTSNGGSSRTASFSCAANGLNSQSRDAHQGVRILKSPQDYQIRDERIVFVSGKRAPIAIFSALPHSGRGLYGTLRSDVRQDLSKRRHASGSRQLSTISDGPDPLDFLTLMGFDRTVDVQDISFSELLTCHKKTKLNCVYTLQEAVAYYHNLVSLCFSHDQTLKAFQFLPNQMTLTQSCCNFENGNIIDDKKHYSHQYFVHHSNVYHPNMLDDPELIAGKHSTLLAFPSFVTSIIDYVKPCDLKKELNDKFKERFSYIQLTLSKLRSLKKEMCKIARFECNIDFLTIAQAYVYFEKLILKSLINKQNRKLCAGACLLLSAKLNDVKGGDLKNLIEKIESGFRFSRKELISMEFNVLVALEFSLHLPNWEITPHFQRLLYES